MNDSEQTLPPNALARLGVRMAGIIYPCTRKLSILSMIASACMALTVAADVFMRRVFNSPIYGSYDIVNILLVVIVFASVAYVQTIQGHVMVDTVTRLYPRKLKLPATGIAQILSIALMTVIFWQTVKYALAMHGAGESMVLTRIPVAPFLFVVALGYLLFGLVMIVQFIFTLAGVDEDAALKLTAKERR